MNSFDISAALRKAGSSQSEIARNCEVAPPSVNKVVRGQNRSERIERAISEATQLPLHVLWPQFYSAPVGSAAPTPAPKAPAFDPLADMLMREFAKMDMANKARLLSLAGEINQGFVANTEFAKAVADLEAQSSTAHFAKKQAAKDAQDAAELDALVNKPVMPSGTQQSASASVVVHGNAEGNQFHDNRGSSAPMTFNMGKKSK